MKQLGKQEKTISKFPIIEFIDSTHGECLLQASCSSFKGNKVGQSAILLGRFCHPMILDREQVEILVNHLQIWLNNEKSTFVKEEE